MKTKIAGYFMCNVCSMNCAVSLLYMHILAEGENVLIDELEYLP